MKQKNKGLIKFLIFVIAVTSLICFMLWRTRDYNKSSYEHIVNSYPEDTQVSKTYLKGNKSSETDYSVIAENDYLEISFDDKTFDIGIYDKVNNNVYYTIPKDIEEDEIANGYEKNYIGSHLLVNYFDNDRNSMRYLSKSNAVASVNTIENGVRITYNIGDFDKDITFLPTYLTIERVGELTSGMEEDQLKFFNKYYYEITEGDHLGFYGYKVTLSDSAINTNKMIELFESLGYNNEQLVYDNELAGIDGTNAKTQISISVDFVLDDNKLKITIPNDLIDEVNGKIAYIDFMPFFVSGSINNNGYFLLPDGSGSIMEFNNEDLVDRQYVQPVYDFDRQNKTKIDAMNEEKITMPVFAMSSDKGSVFARITEGAANSYILANESSRNNSYNNVYPRFYFRDSTLLNMSGVAGATSDMTVVEDERAKTDFTVEYTFMPEESTYVDFAKEYRKQLIDEGIITKLEESDDIPLYIDVIGGVTGTTYNYIFKDTGAIIGTNYEQTLDIAKDLDNSGINNLVFNIKGWFNNGTNNDYAGNIDLIKDMGSKKELYSLRDYLNEIGGSLFLETNFIKTSYSDSDYDEERMGSRLLSGYTAVDSPYGPMQYKNNALSQTYYLNSAGIIGDTVKDFLRDYNKLRLNGIGINPADLSYLAVSDKNKKRTIDRTTATNIYNESLNILADNVDLLLTEGNEYSLKYSQNIKDVSTESNEYAITNYSVPFKQIVLHGYVNMGAKAINNTSIQSKEYMLLKLLETGTYPTYLVSYVPTSTFNYTSFSEVFSTEYSIIENDIKEMYEEVNNVLKNVYNVPIENHKIDENNKNIVTVTYENGDVIVLNYGNSNVSTKYGVVNSLGYIYKGGEN